MADPIYRELMKRFAQKGERYPGMDIPEFYAMAEALFTAEEASVAVAMPRGLSTAEQLAKTLNRDREEVEGILRTMASKGLCMSVDMGGSTVYSLPSLVPGILEFQFMRGTKTERDRRLARLSRRYKEAVDAIHGIPETPFPTMRVIPVDEKVEPGHTVRTYDQVSAYVESSDRISVCTCYCRHEAELLDPNDTCGKPKQVCMQLGVAARFTIEQEMGREVSKQEALDILKKSEEEGLVHCTVNLQNDIEFVCNCCADHCLILTTALAQARPGRALNSGFQPRIDHEECDGCEVCVDKCPAAALAMSEDDALLLDLDRCFGCGVCATSCPTEAISLIAKPGYPEPPVDQRALERAFKAASAP